MFLILFYIGFPAEHGQIIINTAHLYFDEKYLKHFNLHIRLAISPIPSTLLIIIKVSSNIALLGPQNVCFFNLKKADFYKANLIKFNLRGFHF